ncbi:MAG: hypothetical protein JSV17_09685 [Candidatus Aminicenantes bacterium]|nr:MAG: hypothetical protein JSV17_09685 [Candidatus Aminicenantes bacterium]
MESYFFFTLLVELDLEIERDEEDREGVDRETRVDELLLKDRDMEELLDDEMRLGEYDLLLEEEVLILVVDRLGVE